MRGVFSAIVGVSRDVYQGVNQGRLRSFRWIAGSLHGPVILASQENYGLINTARKDSARQRGLQPDTFAYKLRVFLDLVRFEHTIFALPFAYIGMVLAADGLPTLWQFVWVTVAMAAARTLAFAINRLADRAYDARNPRTKNRPSVTGQIAPRTILLFAGVSLLVLLIAAALLDPLALELAPVAVLFLIGYSFTKRFTVLAHWVLGFTDALAVGGGWIAVRGSFFGGGRSPGVAADRGGDVLDRGIRPDLRLPGYGSRCGGRAARVARAVWDRQRAVPGEAESCRVHDVPGAGGIGGGHGVALLCCRADHGGDADL